MARPIHLLAAVALTSDIPEQGLVRGQVGTVVELLGPRAYEVEFCDEEGRTYAQLAVPAEQLMVLRYEPATG